MSVARDAALSYDDVEVPTGLLSHQLRREQDEHFKLKEGENHGPRLRSVMSAVQASKWTKRGVGYARRLPGRVAKKLTEPVLGSVRSVVTTAKVAAPYPSTTGPHPEHTPRLLDVLAMHGAKATFFVVGAAG